MTIIELNIAGLHLTRSTRSRRAVKRSLHRNCRTWRQNMNAPWTQLRGRHAAERSAA